MQHYACIIRIKGMKISDYKKYNRYSDSQNRVWVVTHLIWKAKDLAVFDYPINEVLLDQPLFWKLNTTRDFLVHFEKTIQASADFPIILSAEGDIMDGRHRIIKAILDGKTSIRAVKFVTTPEPDYTD